jgi:Probable molybdopterin binding domain
VWGFSLLQTTDTNSSYMAKFCFNLGISLKRVEVIGDDEDEIIEACRRMSKNYDFVVTSGGIGPTWVACPQCSIAVLTCSVATTTSHTNR